MKEKIRKIVEKAIGGGKSVEIFVPEQEAFGHYSTNIALRLAKETKKEPLFLAEEIARKCFEAAPKGFFEKVEAVRPGFVNFWIAPAVFQKELKEILKQKGKYGRAKAARPQKIQVEFVSANPTGPLTLANGRGGFFGDALSNVLEAAGHKVEREYYVNDTGNQILTFGESILAAEGLIPEEETFYKGEYVKGWARTHARMLPGYRGKPLALGQKAAADFLKKAQSVLRKKAHIRFDRFTSEDRHIHKKNYIAKVMRVFEKAGVTYKKDGALWLKTTAYGDDKDRVLVTSDGFPTYFLADAGHYLETKERAFARKINILGPDHYGYVARIQAAAKLVGLKRSEVLITQTVRVMQDGVEVKMSKRKGSFVEFEELLDEVPPDAARFFFLMTSLPAHMDFDLALAREHSMKNPVYYVQYAHVRAANILKNLKWTAASARRADAERLNTAEDVALMRELARFPEVVLDTAEDYQIHRLTAYAFGLARAFHHFYEKERVIGADKETAAARAMLVAASEIVTKNLFGILGISAPKKM